MRRAGRPNASPTADQKSCALANEELKRPSGEAMFHELAITIMPKTNAAQARNRARWRSSFTLFGDWLASVHRTREEAPNDPKLSDRGGWRGMRRWVCGSVAHTVTAVAVRCSAWLGVIRLAFILASSCCRRRAGRIGTARCHTTNQSGGGAKWHQARPAERERWWSMCRGARMSGRLVTRALRQSGRTESNEFLRWVRRWNRFVAKCRSSRPRQRGSEHTPQSTASPRRLVECRGLDCSATDLVAVLKRHELGEREISDLATNRRRYRETRLASVYFGAFKGGRAL